MTHSLQDKVIIVTGAGAGIGWGIVRCCVAAGATVVMADINAAAESRAAELREEGADVLFVHTDVSEPDSIANLVKQVAGLFGRIDGLINNAGVTIDGDFLSFPIDKLEKMWATNLRSVFLICQGVARVMKEAGAGAIVNISSNHAIASVPGYEMYAATKGGIAAMTRAMCWSLGQHGIRVNTLSPGLTQTEVIADMTSEKPNLQKTFGRLHATGEYSTVDQIGDIAVFLLSDASKALVGATLVADQGMVAGLCSVEDLK